MTAIAERRARAMTHRTVVGTALVDHTEAALTGAKPHPRARARYVGAMASSHEPHRRTGSTSSKSVAQVLPDDRWTAAMAGARRRWPTHLREQIATVAGLHAETRNAPLETFFRRAWETSALEGAARAFFDVIGPSKATQTMNRLSVPEGAVRIAPGPLHVSGSIMNGGMLIVGGNLVVGGDVTDAHVGRMTVTLGDLRCRALSVRGGVITGGSLTAERFVGGAFDEDAIVVRGTLTSPLVVVDGNKPLRAKRVAALRIDTSLPFGQLRAIAERLDSEFVRDASVFDTSGDDDEEVDVSDFLDLEALERAARAGRRIVREARRPRATRPLSGRGPRRG